MNDIRDDLRAIRQKRHEENCDWAVDIAWELTVFGLVCVICWMGYLCIR